MKAMPRQIAVKPALRVPGLSRRPTAWPTPHRRRHRDAERHHEHDRSDGQRDLMRCERGGADPPHQQSGRGEHAVFEREGAGDRRADDEQPPKQRPVRPPEAAQHAEFLERPLRVTDPDRGGAHADIDGGRGEAGAEQVKLAACRNDRRSACRPEARWSGSPPSVIHKPGSGRFTAPMKPRIAMNHQAGIMLQVRP